MAEPAVTRSTVLGVEVDTSDLDDTDAILDVFVIVKVLDRDGRRSLLAVSSDGFEDWEALGAVRSVELGLEETARGAWGADD